VFPLDCLLQTWIYYCYSFFLSLAVFGFILNKLPFKWYIKYQLCYLKRCLYTHRNSICSLLQFFFFIITCSFSVFVENCIFILPKGINEFVIFLCIVHVWFWFFTLLLRFLLLVIKGQFIPRTKILLQSAFFFSYKNIASKSIRVKYTLFP
jgi:hypothetical protein